MPTELSFPACGFLPTGNKIVVVRDSVPDTVGLLALPENAKPRPASGTAIAFGTGAEEGREGWRCIFAQAAGVSILVGDEPYLILSEEEILGWIDPGAPVAAA